MNPSASHPTASRRPGPGETVPSSQRCRTDRSDRRDRSGPDNLNLDRALPPLPPVPSSLPSSYEIPSLRRRPQADKSATNPEKHNRSVSHPFPGLFGAKKNTNTDDSRVDDDLESSDGGHRGSSGLSRSKSGISGYSKATQADRKPVTGKCMTCDVTVRWPDALKVFRCTTCLTVNDLEPRDPSDGRSEKSANINKPMAISLNRTQKLIDQCVHIHLQSCLDNAQTPVSINDVNATHEPGPGNSDEQRRGRQSKDEYDRQLPGHRSQSASQHLSLATTPNTDKPYQDQELSRETRKHLIAVESPSTQEVPSRRMVQYSLEDPLGDRGFAIFHLVEAYITVCLTGCTSFNLSFFSAPPADEGKPGPDRAKSRTKLPNDPTPSPRHEHDLFLSEIDAKTLLLADVVENGSWWTGKPGPREGRNNEGRGVFSEKLRGLVSVKSPRINWPELLDWYKIIIYAGDRWQQRWHLLRPADSDPRLKRWESLPIDRLRQQFTESQVHLQRVLLKATENLLKRPRKPLRNPEDCRFLLMLLANPLLYPNSDRPPTMTANSNMSEMDGYGGVSKPGLDKSKPSRPQLIKRRTGGLGHHTGIIKRILGLLSNLSNDIHQFFVSWMSRFSDSHFQKLVDLISSFMTHRLSRQQDRSVVEPVNPTDGLVPTFSGAGAQHAAQVHAALELRPATHPKKKHDNKPKLGIYSEDWQVRSAARVMSLMFQANIGHTARRRDTSISPEQRLHSAGLNAKYHAYSHGQILPISSFYNSMLDHADLVGDFEAWETTKTRFTFCQYPFFLSIWAKIHILEHDARRQMENMAREAFFDSILRRKAVSQYLVLKVRRDCLVDDSLRGVSEVIGSGSSDIKKGLRIDFVNEEGVDAGGLRKEWFLLLVREIFDPQHGLFVYDEDSRYCYFNPFCFESSEQFFLVGVLLGLAIYNSTILDIALPPFVFKKMLASAPPSGDKLTSAPKSVFTYSLEDLAEYRPALAKGLRQLLEFDGDVQETFCQDFVAEMDRYGEITQIPLCQNGAKRAVTNANRREFVDLYVRYLLDTAVARQFEPFKRGFFTVCGGNALSLFQPEEIELLVRGSDEPLDVRSLQAVATYDNWPESGPQAEEQPQVQWFWNTFEQAEPADQRKLLSFITGSDRIPAIGTTNLSICVQCIRNDKGAEQSPELEIERFPIARTCFNTINLHQYRKKETLEGKLWMAVRESEGFGLK